jgi:membrane protein DedA with SNARE-associated domain
MDRLVDFLLNFYGPTPYFLVLGILLACGIGLPIPEDITLFAAGLLCYYGLTNLGLMIGVALFGVIAGDSLIFYLGHHFGRKLTKKWFFHKLLPDDRLTAVQRKFKRRGNKLIFAARFMPGLRAPIYFSAGTLHLPPRVFWFYDGMAALISVPLIIGAVYYFGDELDKVVRVIQRIEHGIVFVIAGVLLLVLGKWYVTHRRLKRSEIFEETKA